MIGDIIIAVKLVFKQQTCLHDYEEKVINMHPPHYYKICKKCDRVK